MFYSLTKVRTVIVAERLVTAVLCNKYHLCVVTRFHWR